jgi:hypothetical protein
MNPSRTYGVVREMMKFIIGEGRREGESELGPERAQNFRFFLVWLLFSLLALPQEVVMDTAA